MCDVIVRKATPGDTDAWMALLLRMERFFPGLDEAAYQQTLARNIARGSALCATRGGAFAGALLFSVEQSTLSFLVVDPAHRRAGVATALVERMLEAFPPDADVYVTTYPEGDDKAPPARALYARLGFVHDAYVEEFGYAAERLVLRR